MSTGVDLSQFFETFFDEADELLADMEQQLLTLDIAQPDADQLNAIFRAAHSIKGGAGTFGCFAVLADTTHMLENLLDLVRRGEVTLRTEMIDLFLETKDVLTDQVLAYRNDRQPDADACQRVCEQLRLLALEGQEGSGPGAGFDRGSAIPANAPEPQPQPQPQPGLEPESANAGFPHAGAGTALPLCVRLARVGDKDAETLSGEMALLGTVLFQQRHDDSLTMWLDSTASADDVVAVCCFVINADQVSVSREALPAGAHRAVNGVVDGGAAACADAPATDGNGSGGGKSASRAAAAGSASSGGTLRVGVEKVDQIINLVGELVITQAMLNQMASTLDPVIHDRLLNGIEQLERNARDLQEAIMSIRMVPMDYVFSRFPRVVRESASRLDKQIRLVTRGAATELDKSLIERIIDPLTHLVRNSIDHGIEPPARRAAAGKVAEGTVTLAAQHAGGAGGHRGFR